MGCFRQVRLLLWKNAISKKRALGGSLLEIILPIIMVLVLLAIYSVTNEETVPNSQYVVELQQGVLTTHKYNQAVPAFAFTPLRLQAMNSKVYVCGGTSDISLQDVNDFVDAMDAQYPGGSFDLPLFDQTHTWEIPKFSDVAIVEPDQSRMLSMIERDSYAQVDGGETIFAAIVLNHKGSATQDWDYSIRMNGTALPYTQLNVDILARDVNSEAQQDYIRASSPFQSDSFDENDAADLQSWLLFNRLPGFLTYQRMVDRYIINEKVDGTLISDDKIVELFTNEALQTIGFPTIQWNTYIAELRTNDTTAYNNLVSDIRAFMDGELYAPQTVRMAPFPIIGFTSNVFYQIVASSFGLFMVLAFLYPTSRLIRGLVHEKETKIREGMQMMGLGTGALYISWFVTYLIMYTIISLLASIIMVGSMFSNSSFGAVFIMFFLFGISTTCFCFLISVFFSRAKTAATIGVLVYLGGFFPYYAVNGADQTASSKIAASIGAPTAFAQSLATLASFEDRGQGITGSTINLEYQNYAFNYGLAMMVVDSLLYLILAWYFDAVWPREFGIRRPFYFLLTPSYWREVLIDVCGICKRSNRSNGPATEYVSTNDLAAKDPLIEPVDSTFVAKERDHRVVQTQHLRKVFGSGDDAKVAVNDVSLTMYEGQIFVLLGHNGAGKTTTISMLTGLLSPTSGGMRIYGENVGTDLASIRQQLGVCPQHDVLWPDLTVEEHLKIYAGFKRVPASEVNAAVSSMIAEVGLTEKIKTKSCELSGGQKRKLSVGIALIGGSKIVFLDEPTSGMDPYSRRSTWQLIQNARRGRIIVLTTHFMDEADLLGDRICIMAHGKVKCCGSSMFLKQQYGVGYLLTAVKTRSCDVSKVTNILQKHVPEAEVHSSVGTELSYRLPMGASKKFPAMLSELDHNLDRLGLQTYGIGVTTMEEVFLRVAHGDIEDMAKEAEEKKKKSSSKQTLSDSPANSPTSKGSSSTQIVPAEGESGKYNTFNKQDQNDAEGLEQVRKHAQKLSSNNFFRHFRALFVKRWHFYKRDSKSACFQLVVPILAVLCGLILIRVGTPSGFPSYSMSTAKFNLDSNGDTLTNYVPFTDFIAQQNGLTASYPRASSLMSQIPNVNASLLPQSSTATTGIDDIFGFYANTFGKDNSTELAVYKSLVDFNTFLLNDRTAYEASKYAAYGFFPQLMSASDIISENSAYEVMVFQNSSAYHATAINLNLVNGAIYRLKNPAGRMITTRSHPLPFTGRQKTVLTGFTSFFAAVIIMLAFAFIPASYAIFIVKEREISAKHQQLISGVSIPAYWVSTWIWDFASYLLPMAGTMILIAAFDVQDFIGTDRQRLASLFLLLIFYGTSVSGFTYCICYLFKSYSTAQNAVLFVNQVCMLLMIASFIMGQIDSTCQVDSALRYIYRLFPGFALGNGLVQLSFLSVLQQFGTCDSSSASGAQSSTNPASLFKTYNALDWVATGANITYMAILTFVFMAITIGVDIFLSRPDLIQKFKRKPVANDKEQWDPALEDADVHAEAERCDRQGKSYSVNDDVILLQHLRKIYPGGKVAVRDLSFGIPVGEVFGFLGINGAGKTSTLKMLSGDILPTSGAARLAGYDVVKEQLKLRNLLGYCPQFDALLELVTVREHLELFARIKGIPESQIPGVVKEKISQMQLEEFENKKAGTLSGGNKRKLSVAIALIGNPKVCFLDEPSTGVDPVARRFLWNVINKVATEDKSCSIILTTHSMEECEALCSRVGIMVGGRLRCLGSIQHIKNTHGQGFQASIKLNDPSNATITQYTEQIHQLLESNGKLVRAASAPALETASSNKRLANDTNSVSVVTPVKPEPYGEIHESSLLWLCQALHKPGRASEISPEGTGWAIAASIHRSTTKTVSIDEFALWWAEEEEVDQLRNYIESVAFRGATLIERHGTSLSFKIPPQGIALSEMFGRLEQRRTELNIREYALSQTTLEQIFNHFASQQQEERGVARGMIAAPTKQSATAVTNVSSPLQVHTRVQQ